MKNIVASLAFVVLALTGQSAFAELRICLLKADGQTMINGQVPARDTTLARINEARLDREKGENCDTWRAQKSAELTKGSPGMCVLLAAGNQIFEGFGDKPGEAPPKRGTEIVKGSPNPGQTCDQWREQQAEKLLIG